MKYIAIELHHVLRPCQRSPSTQSILHSDVACVRNELTKFGNRKLHPLISHASGIGMERALTIWNCTVDLHLVGPSV